jgi:hypothetical protein
MIKNILDVMQGTLKKVIKVHYMKDKKHCSNAFYATKYDLKME